MTTKTYRLRAADIDRAWQVVDAADRPLGRVASEAARMLLGKHKPTYEPHLPMGDHVIIVNAAKVALTGNKAEQKVYYRHSGYPGGLRTRSFEMQMERDPRRVLERAVRGMLPHNSLGRELFRHLKVYAGAEHPHEAQVNAGTGERARKRVARTEREAVAKRERASARPAPATPPTPAAAPAADAPAADAANEAALRLSGALSRHTRGELDAEAERLGITIESSWNKPDVVAAVEAYYEAHPVETEE